MINYKKSFLGVFSEDFVTAVSAKQELKSYARSADRYYEVKTDPEVIANITNICFNLTGKNFKEWLRINAEKGKQVSLVKEIIRYLNGETTSRGIDTQILIGENRVIAKESETFDAVSTYTPGKYDIPGIKTVTNKDFYKLVEAIGPYRLARLFLMILGDTINVERK